MKETKTFIIKGIVASIIILGIFYIGLVMVDRFIDTEIAKVDAAAENILLKENLFQCDITYGDVHYKGLCNDEIIEYFNNLGKARETVKFIEICGNTPYAYRLDVCKEVI